MTISLVQLYTALSQIMAEKVARGDNSPVDVYVDAEFTYTNGIKFIDTVVDDDGRLTKIVIKAGKP